MRWVRLLAASLACSAAACNGAAAAPDEPCSLIAENRALPSASIAGADRYADLAMMFGIVPGLENLPVKRLTSATDIRVVAMALDRAAAQGQWRAEVDRLRPILADSLQAAIEAERTPEIEEDLHPLTEQARVFSIGMPDGLADSGTTSVVAIADGVRLAVMSIGGTSARPDILLVRDLGSFDRFGAIAWGGAAWIFHRTSQQASFYPLRGGAGETNPPPACTARIAIGTKVALEPHVGEGLRPPEQDLSAIPYPLSAILERNGGIDLPEGGLLLTVYESGASRVLGDAEVREVIARETKFSPEEFDRLKSSVGVGGDRTAQPGNVQSLLKSGDDWRPEALILDISSDRFAVLCALYEVPNTSSLAAFAALQPYGQVSGAVACATARATGDMGDAAQAILAERNAAETGDGYAFWIVEQEYVLGLPAR